MLKSFYLSCLCIVVLLTVSTPAYAYLDPGTGSMILQGLAAAFFGGIFFSKRIIASIKSYFNRSKGESSDHNAKNETGKE